MVPAVEAVDLGKHFPRKQVGKGLFSRWFRRRQTAEKAPNGDVSGGGERKGPGTSRSKGDAVREEAAAGSEGLSAALTTAAEEATTGSEEGTAVAGQSSTPAEDG